MTTDEKLKIVVNLYEEWKRLKPVIRAQARYQKEFGNEQSDVDPGL